MAVALNLFAIPPGVPFLEALAAGWLRERGDDPLSIANGLILTPTRRAARSLAEAFLRVSPSRGLLLPRIVALGALDETPLTLEGALELPPAVDPHRRLAVLTHLILRMNGAGGAPRTADRAWLLAARTGVTDGRGGPRGDRPRRARLPDAADPAFAAHWARTLEFLRIVTHAWPGWLEENGVMNPSRPPGRAVERSNSGVAGEAAGSAGGDRRATAGIPAVARLARVVARLPLGRVVLPVLDTLMTARSWVAMEHSHPQAGLADLLAGLDATRDDVRVWGDGDRPHTQRHGPARPDHQPQHRVAARSRVKQMQDAAQSGNHAGNVSGSDDGPVDLGHEGYPRQPLRSDVPRLAAGVGVDLLAGTERSSPGRDVAPATSRCAGGSRGNRHDPPRGSRNSRLHGRFGHARPRTGGPGVRGLAASRHHL